AGYEKALEKANAIDSNDHQASIGFSMAMLQAEAGQTDAAIASLRQAKTSAQGTEDDELKADIDDLLEKLTTGQEPDFDQ
ncbi:MAG: tetratricopeptide repeat protein, partial [Halomonas sp.]